MKIDSKHKSISVQKIIDVMQMIIITETNKLIENKVSLSRYLLINN